MKITLIGNTGFVGKNLLEQFNIENTYNSSNINEFSHLEHDLVLCAAPSAEKWIANKNPIEDLEKIYSILKSIKNSKVRKFILFSTVDVYGSNFAYDEDYSIGLNSLHAYGKNRYILETYVSDLFDSHIVRLPALFGKGLKKNIIYDLLNDNLINNISLETQFQWFYTDELKTIVDLVLKKDIKLINCVTEPLYTRELVEEFFPNKLRDCRGTSKVKYNVLTKHSSSGYLFDREKVKIFLKDFLYDINK